MNSLPVLRAAEEAGRLSGLTVVTTDLFPELVDWIRAGKVAATMYQRPLSQGRLALQALYQYLVDGTHPSSKLRVVPHIVMRSNLDQFLERLSVDVDSLDSSPATDRRRHRAPSPLTDGSLVSSSQRQQSQLATAFSSARCNLRDRV